MKLAPRSLYRAGLLTALAAIVFTVGCAKKQVAAPPPPPPPAPAPARPTVTLQASPGSINKGESSTLSWNSTDATQLNIAPEVGPVTAQGSTKVTPPESTTYTITASGPGGSATATAMVNVAAPPPPPPPPPPDYDKIFREVRDAYFDYNKADIRPDAREALSKTADLLKNYPQFRVTIEGHCDERGSTEYNLGLGDRRAAAVKQYLVSLGISADRLSTVSFGKEKPFCMESNETCWQQNRRGHFVKAN
jgi:peptidoglycan-associated lipoprotein